jgi:hypothetical protein
LLVEWPSEELDPTKYFLSTLPADTPIKELMRLAKLRWRAEREYEELKQELGLGHFEGRSWRGFHHHATLCISRQLRGGATRGATRVRPPANCCGLTDCFGLSGMWVCHT